MLHWLIWDISKSLLSLFFIFSNNIWLHEEFLENPVKKY